MEAEYRPLDPDAMATLVPRVIRELDEATEDELLVLLSDLLWAAWGSITAQNQ